MVLLKNRYEFYSYTNNKTLASDVNFGNHANMDQTTGEINPDAVNYNTNANFPARLSHHCLDFLNA